MLICEKSITSFSCKLAKLKMTPCNEPNSFAGGKFGDWVHGLLLANAQCAGKPDNEKVVHKLSLGLFKGVKYQGLALDLGSGREHINKCIYCSSLELSYCGVLSFGTALLGCAYPAVLITTFRLCISRHFKIQSRCWLSKDVDSLKSWLRIIYFQEEIASKCIVFVLVYHKSGTMGSYQKLRHFSTQIL